MGLYDDVYAAFEALRRWSGSSKEGLSPEH
jgi:hypothetical protein